MLRLRDIMTTDVITVAPETTLRDTMALFSEHHISGAPVVAGSKVLGIISATDIMEFASTASRAKAEPAGDAVSRAWAEAEQWDLDGDAEEHLAEIWTRTAGADGLEVEPKRSGDPLDTSVVADAMTYGIYALPPNAHVSAAAESMRAANVRRLLVMEDERLVGIVSTMDLVRAVADRKLVRRTYVFDRSPPRG